MDEELLEIDSFHVMLLFETKDNVILQLLKSSLSNEVTDTLAWT